MSANGLSDERLRTMQIIAAALMIGVLSFASVAVFITLQKEAVDSFMTYMGVGFAVMAIVTQTFVPAIIANSAFEQLGQRKDPSDEQKLVDEVIGIYQTKMIVGLAMLEGAAFFNLIAYMSTAQWWMLVVVGMLLLAMAMRFPTRFKVESWIETKQHELEMGR